MGLFNIKEWVPDSEDIEDIDLSSILKDEKNSKSSELVHRTVVDVSIMPFDDLVRETTESESMDSVERLDVSPIDELDMTADIKDLAETDSIVNSYFETEENNDTESFETEENTDTEPFETEDNTDTESFETEDNTDTESFETEDETDTEPFETEDNTDTESFEIEDNNDTESFEIGNNEDNIDTQSFVTETNVNIEPCENESNVAVIEKGDNYVSATENGSVKGTAGIDVSLETNADITNVREEQAILSVDGSNFAEKQEQCDSNRVSIKLGETDKNMSAKSYVINTNDLRKASIIYRVTKVRFAGPDK